MADRKTLTPEESKCVQRVLSKKLGPGQKPSDQDLAIAISECRKSTKKDKPKKRKEGSRSYSVERANDGTFTIFDVPIFATHVEERGEDPIDFDATWLAGALAHAKILEAEGYLPPLHVHHHDASGQPVEAAGKFRLTRIGPIQVEGEDKHALFADLVGVRPDVYDRIRKGELSYRSVEILDVGKQAIDSLALLDDEVPFFRFPLLRVEESESITRKAGDVVLAYRAKGNRTAVLTRFSQEANMNGEQQELFSEDKQPMQFQDDMLLQIMQLLQLVAKELGVGVPNEEEEEGEEAPPMQADPTPVEVGAPGSNTPTSEQAGAFAAMQAKLSAMESKLAAQETQRQVDARAHELRQQGFTEEQVVDFRAHAKAHGTQAALAYSAGMQRVGALAPPATWTGEIQSAEIEPKEVQAFAAKGPETLDNARQLWRSWKRSGSTVPLNDYLEANMDPDAFLGVGK